MSKKQDSRSCDDRRLFGRRSWLKATASVATLGAIGIGTAAADNYDVIRVPAGDTYRVSLESGDSIENAIIDITARNAAYQINAVGSNWTIRNVGVRGVWDRFEKAEPLIASVPDANASARIENLYLGDGATDDTYPGATGIFVPPSHAGTLEIDRVNIQGYPDNAIYGSSPGNTNAHPAPGSGGEVHITNSFAADCRAGGFRIGTAGSYVENCVAVSCDRNFWGFYEQTEAIDCDFSNGRFGDVGTGDNTWRANARARVRNTRFDSTVEHSGRVIGEAVGSPERTEPEDVSGVPLSAEEAAAGGRSEPPSEPDGGDTDDGESDDGQDDGEEPEEDREIDVDGHLLAFVTEPEASLAGYEFRAVGTVEFTEAPYESPSGGRIEGGTFVAEDFIEDDGETVHAGGVTGGGQGDAFVVDGPITEIDIGQPDVMWVELDGKRLSPEEILEETGGDEDEETDQFDTFEYAVEANEADVEYFLEGVEGVAFTPVQDADSIYVSPDGTRVAGLLGDGERHAVEGRLVEESAMLDVDVRGDGEGFIDGNESALGWYPQDGASGDEWKDIDALLDLEDDPDEDNESSEDEDGDESTPDLPKAVIIDGTDGDEPSRYTFSVSEAIEPSSEWDGTTDDSDIVVDGTTVAGRVDGTRHVFRFVGDVTGFWLDGDASVSFKYDV